MSAAPPRRWLATLTGLALALVLPVVLTAAPERTLGASNDMTRATIMSEAAMWALALAVLAIVKFWERRPLASIGLARPTWPAIRFGVGIVFGLIALALVAGLVVQASGLPMPTGPAEIVLALPLWLQLAVAASAGFTEEILFRGYSIERTTELTGNRWLGALLPVVVFGAAHAPFWGVAHAIVAGFTGLWLTLLYLWRRNLWTNIVAHALLDGLVFVALDSVPAATG